MTKHRLVLATLSWALLLSCNNASMSGNSSQRVAQADAKAKPADEEEPEALGKTKPGNKVDEGSNDDEPKDDGQDDDTAQDLGSGDDAGDVKADEVVDGMDVITDCTRCVARAKQLSKTIGFEADISRTYNLGFYKIDPSRNLCDIHFMQDMSIRISDHEGKNSVLDRQIAFYCPCNCGWASEGPFGNIFP